MESGPISKQINQQTAQFDLRVVKIRKYPTQFPCLMNVFFFPKSPDCLCFMLLRQWNLLFYYYLGDIFFSYKLMALNRLWKNVAKFYIRQKGIRQDSRHRTEFRKSKPRWVSGKGSYIGTMLHTFLETIDFSEIYRYRCSFFVFLFFVWWGFFVLFFWGGYLLFFEFLSPIPVCFVISWISQMQKCM